MRELHAPGKEAEGNFLIERMRKLLEIELNLSLVLYLNSVNNHGGEIVIKIEPDGAINNNSKLSILKKVRGYGDTGNEFDSIKTIIDNVLSDEDENRVQNIIKKNVFC